MNQNNGLKQLAFNTIIKNGITGHIIGGLTGGWISIATVMFITHRWNILLSFIPAGLLVMSCLPNIPTKLRSFMRSVCIGSSIMVSPMTLLIYSAVGGAVFAYHNKVMGLYKTLMGGILGLTSTREAILTPDDAYIRIPYSYQGVDYEVALPWTPKVLGKTSIQILNPETREWEPYNNPILNTYMGPNKKFINGYVPPMSLLDSTLSTRHNQIKVTVRGVETIYRLPREHFVTSH